ncbi:MAG: hypothetical protein AB7G23_13550 [Vicinamibacterales bacterium]
MSLELLLLVAVMVLLPLIQQLLDAARRRAAGAGTPGAAAPSAGPKRPAGARPTVPPQASRRGTGQGPRRVPPGRAVPAARATRPARAASTPRVVPPPLPPVAHQTPDAVADVAHGDDRPPVAVVVPRLVQAPARRARRRLSAQGLGTAFDLRRAVVAAAVLGPCRAMDPYEGPGRDRSRPSAS